MKTILQLSLVVILALGWLPAAAQGEAPVGVPQPSPMAESFTIDNTEPYAQELVGQVFLPALGTDHNGADSLEPSGVTAGTVAAVGARTTDKEYVTRSTFYPGQAIKYIGTVGNTTGAARTATLRWRLAGPCGAGTLWSGSRTAAAGTIQWVLDRFVPKCPGNYTFTFSVIYAGVTTSRSSNFSVISNTGSITVTGARTTDINGYIRTSYYRNQPMWYVGDLYNTTGASRVVFMKYSLAGPCWAGILWQGNVTTGTGTIPWGIKYYAPPCPGNFTLTVSATYGGLTTSRSTNFSIY
ncbi:MAG: hypothetical protein IPK16_14725 [Anaerolineales bacterium]|nr:hypothetical protein [Anaerolineales bacterium]